VQELIPTSTPDLAAPRPGDRHHLDPAFDTNWHGVDMLAITDAGRGLVVHAKAGTAAGGVVVIDTTTDAVVGSIPPPIDSTPAGIASIVL